MTNMIFQTTIGEVILGDYPWVERPMCKPYEISKARQIGTLLQIRIVTFVPTSIKYIEVPITLITP